MTLTVDDVERIPVKVPFREVPGRNLRKEQPNWQYFEVVEVTLESGDRGYGEAMLDYWSHQLEADDVAGVEGSNAAARMYDDSLGWALQTALFDAVGRATGVPVHDLLGEQVHDTTPVAWWCVDMPAADWVAEAERALDEGYTDIKVKGRPWFDVREQIDRLCEVLPRSASVDVDFNDTLLDAERGIPILQELDEYPQVETYESPIPQEDVEGNRRIRRETEGDVAMHYGTPEPMTALREDVCDGFVVTGTADRLGDIGAVAATADKPFFLQLVGTGITAAHSLHHGAVLENATWPGIDCHEIYVDDLLTEPIDVADGRAEVPDGPGLGHRVDRDVLERYRVEEDEPLAEPDRLIEVDWAGGPTMYFAGVGGQLMNTARAGEMPYFEREVATRVVEDDGSDWWAETHERALEEPVVEE